MTRNEIFEEMRRLVEDAAEVGKMDAGFLTSNAGVSYCAGCMIGFSSRARGILKTLKDLEAVGEETY